MLGVTFGSKHSYNDWGIWLEDTHINPPLPKRYIVDVPARNGLLDLTPELTPTIRFENRTLTFNFRVKAGDWSTLVSQIYGDIHGRTLDVVSDLDPNWHWHGCVTVDDFSSDQRTGKLVITVDADPFKLSNTESSYTVNGNGTITCVVDRMEISPAFEIEAPTTVIYGDSSYVLESTATTEKTLSGDNVSFADGTANPAIDLTADVAAVQDLHGYDHPWVGGTGKNLLKVINFSVGQTKSVNGVDFTYNSDGSFTINGTSSTNNNFVNLNYTANAITIPYGVSVNIGFYASSTNSNVNLQWSTPTGQPASLPCSSSGFNISADTTATLGSKNSSWLRIQISTSGTTVNNLKIYPFWCLSSNKLTQYEPYSNICPISGWDEVNVTRTGKNLYIGSPSFDGYTNIGGYSVQTETYNGHEVIAKSEAWNGAYKNVNVKANITYTFSAMIKVSAPTNVNIYNANNQAIGTMSISSANTWSKFSATFTPSADTTERLRVETSTSGTTIYLSEYQLELGSTATAYEPYNGNTYTINLNGTRYGGTLDVTTGVLTLTHGILDLGTLSWSSNWSSTPTGVFYTNVIDYINFSGNAKCSAYMFSKDDNPNAMLNGAFTLFSTNSRIYVKNTAYDNGTAMKNSLSGTMMLYELATPQVVQLTPTQVMILKNQNNIWADSGEVEVTYLAQDFAGKKFFIPDLEFTEGSHELTIQGTGTTTVTYTNGRL